MAEDTKWTNGVDPSFLRKSEIFQGGMKGNIIGANTDKGIFFMIHTVILGYPQFLSCAKQLLSLLCVIINLSRICNMYLKPRTLIAILILSF